MVEIGTHSVIERADVVTLDPKGARASDLSTPAPGFAREEL